jgi:hypothetical protein
VIDVWGALTTICPPYRLPKIIRAIETPRKVLGELCLLNFGQFHDLFACMVNEHNFNIIKYPEAKLNGRTATLLLFLKWPCDTATARPASAWNAQTIALRNPG